MALSKPEDPMFVTNFKKRCVNFTLSLIRELKERLPDNYKFLQLMNELTIENALPQVKPQFTSLITLPELQIDADEIELIETQWTNITFRPRDQEIIKKKDSFMFWYMVYEYEDAAGNKPFHQLANFVLKLDAYRHTYTLSNIITELKRPRDKKIITTFTHEYHDFLITMIFQVPVSPNHSHTDSELSKHYNTTERARRDTK